MFRKSLSVVLFTAIVLASLGLAADPKVTIKEWDAKTPGVFPHDPAVGLDGALWYTGQAGNVLGRLYPKTGEIKEYPLKNSEVRPARTGRRQGG